VNYRNLLVTNGEGMEMTWFTNKNDRHFTYTTSVTFCIWTTSFLLTFSCCLFPRSLQ